MPKAPNNQPFSSPVKASPINATATRGSPTKAAPTTTSPTKHAPTKRSPRKRAVGDFSIPLDQNRQPLPTSARPRTKPTSTEWNKVINGTQVLLFDNMPDRSSVAQGSKPTGALWFAEDVFSAMSRTRHLPRDPSPPMDSPVQEQGDESNFPSLADLDGALDEPDVEAELDEATIAAGLSKEAEVEFEAVDDADADKPPVRTEYLALLFASKAPSSLPVQCSNYPKCARLDPGLHSPAHIFRCPQCFGRPLLCGPCLITSHQHSPFHWPEQWVDKNYVSDKIPAHWKDARPAHYGYFKRTSLRNVGLHIGLGHSGALCPRSHPVDTVDLTIVHMTGQHLARFRPCSCSGKELWEQLLEVDIWPATHKSPQTGFTMELLRHQRCFNLRSKTSLKEYYDALVDLTSGAEDKGSIPSAYKQLRVNTREVRILAAHMRAGRFEMTSPMKNGELCVGCPSCPRPGVNLPENWEKDPLLQLSYVRFLAGDGNFKLQHLAKHSSTSAFRKSLFGDGGFW
ncbi:hypothetical protein FRC01_009382, partial [Tulasnella sp. 417]